MGLNDLTEEKFLELAQLGIEDFGDDDDDFELSEIDSEDFGSEEEDNFAQTDANGEGEADADADADIDVDADVDLDADANDEEMFNEVAEFLAQISDDDRSTLQTLVGQVLAEQYSEDGNILLAQAEGEVKESQNEDLDAVAEYLAQLSTEET